MELHCGICIVLVHVLLSIQANESRYCPEAVDSAEYVMSCPSSKSEWDTAAQKKNCSRIALHQNCSTIEEFQYHCVINGYRNKMVEVCAPSRMIFGHCVEFNLHGGVIQDQMLSPCNDTFPKCDVVYKSTAAYEYPDCYDLISKSSTKVDTKVDTSTKINFLTTTPTTDKLRELIPVIASTAIVAILVFIAIVVFLCKRLNYDTSEEHQINGTKPYETAVFMKSEDWMASQ